MPDGPKSLLIIDDDDNFRKILRLVMKGAVDAIIEAADGKTGIASIKKHCPDAIISDYNMPGLNGLEVLKYLKEEKIKIPVIWLTGNGTRELFQDAWRFGVYDFFTKPVDTTQLKECVKTALHFGLDFNLERKPNYLTRVKHKEVQFLLENEIYELFTAHCLNQGVSMTSLIHRLIAEELQKQGKSED